MTTEKETKPSSFFNLNSDSFWKVFGQNHLKSYFCHNVNYLVFSLMENTTHPAFLYSVVFFPKAINWGSAAFNFACCLSHSINVFIGLNLKEKSLPFYSFYKVLWYCSLSDLNPLMVPKPVDFFNLSVGTNYTLLLTMSVHTLIHLVPAKARQYGPSHYIHNNVTLAKWSVRKHVIELTSSALCMF